MGKNFTKIIVLAASIGLSQMLVAAENFLQRSIEYVEEMARFEAQLEDLEFEHGPYAANLVEPLSSMITLAREQQDYNRAGDLMSRQFQIMRTTLGFEHPDLVPLLRDQIANDAARREWEAISDHLDYIRLITAANYGAPSPELLSAMDEQRDWLLARVVFEDNNMRSRLFMDARELTDDIVDMAEELYGEESLEIIPWLYESAISSYHLVEFLNASGGLSGDAIRDVERREGLSKLNTFGRGISSGLVFGDGVRIPIVEEGDLVGEAYLRDSLNLIKDIEEIAVANEDTELEAMAQIYQGDIQILMGLGTAFGDYRDAAEKLVESGIPKDEVDAFFGRPALIPAPQFYSNFADAQEELDSRTLNIGEISSDVVHLGEFIAWEEGLDATAMPRVQILQEEVELNLHRVDISFSVNQRGDVYSVDAISAEPDGRWVRLEATRAARELDIRPALTDGRGTRVRDVHLRYYYLPE